MAAKKRVKAAFERFVALLEPIEDVRHVVLRDESLDIFTYITTMDEKVMLKVIEAEDKVFDDFPELPLDYHIVFLEGRPFEEFVRPSPPLAFHRSVA